MRAWKESSPNGGESPYVQGKRSDAWIKVKNVRTQEVVIGGWTEGAGSRQGSMGALLLGIPSSDGLRFVGKVGTGFSDEDRRLSAWSFSVRTPAKGVRSCPPLT